MTASLTAFSKIQPKETIGKIESIIEKNRQKLETLLCLYEKNPQQICWDNSFEKLDDWDEELMERAYFPVAHLKSVGETPELREVYKEMLPKIIANRTRLLQNKRLYNLVSHLRADPHLSEAQSKALANYQFAASFFGVDLPEKERERCMQLNNELAVLSNRFSENVLDATMKWSKSIKDPKLLTGLPESVLNQIRKNEDSQKDTHYLLNLEEPCYRTIMRQAENEKLREEVFYAYGTRASDIGPSKYDNTPLMADILLLRQEKAKLLGYASSAEMLMAHNMVESPQVVKDFVKNLAEKTLPIARDEAKELKAFALKRKGSEMQPHDTAFYAEKLREEKLNLSTEELRKYFPLDKVFEGMFNLAENLFDIQFREEKDFDAWHSSVRLFSVRRGGDIIGYLYCDLYARAYKRGGAWMDENRQRRRLSDGSLQLPVAYLVCNFRSPDAEGISLLGHQDVLTLFHELGHCLHHVLTQVECRTVSGIAGVPHDMIELPSQIMENWCWDREYLQNISEHYKTKKPLPSEQLNGLVKSRTFQSALSLMRQLEFTRFDMEIHTDLDQETLKKHPKVVLETWQKIHTEYGCITRADFERFPHAFSHVFDGGYAAGYYAYKWAEVMSSDIYGSLEQFGLYGGEIAMKLRRHIFERGGVGDAMQNFKSVLGREPENNAFLKANGIIQNIS